ncbi:hypothetical protein ACFOWX_04120 [Sphingorhabdus arenilitoris]|uniref:Peptidase M15A C-terminal domain-containing protein n=1 Tax=Sphingorhabdus arenilitoris TaxID=1490041 RepID=A0ABV8RE11_9SPHN
MIFLLAAFSLLLTACKEQHSKPSDDEYRRWIAQTDNTKNVAALENYFAERDVAHILPIAELLRSDVRWKKCGADPFSVPPRKYWPNMVATLKLVQREIIPILGPVEAVSVFREPSINTCIKGASKSFHLRFFAIDMQPVGKMDRPVLIQKLCTLHRSKGKSAQMGLGIYRGTRFHIDTAGYRNWGKDYSSKSSPCRSVVAPQH